MLTPMRPWRAAALVAAAGTSAALAGPAVNPTGVASGSAEFSPAGSSLTITASDGAIINYSRFDVAAGESVRFVQPGAEARVLNRVNSVDPTHINGSLSANGVVYLVNPSGVVFGPSSVISAAGVVAAAANLSDADFLAGVDRFAATGGVVSNHGVIQADRLVHLVGSRVENLGSIVAPEGVVSMSAGDEVYLATEGSRLMVRAGGGSPAAPAQADVVHEGSIDAGETLFTTGDLYSIALGGETRSGRVAASGGDVVVEGGAVDASREGGGGEVELTGRTVFVGEGSEVRADALGTGDGGSVIIKADEAAGVFGALSARGATGSGGFVETSAASVLRVTGAPDVSGAAGGGEWLIDPTDLEIVLDGLGTAGVVPTPEGFASSAVGARIEVGTVVAGLLGGDVTLETAAAGPEAGDITLLATLDFDGVTGSTLTLRAHNDINLDRDILDTTFGDGDGLNLRLIADADLSGAGGINQNRDLELGTGSLDATGAFYASAATSEIIGGSATIDVEGAAAVPGRVFLTGPLSVRAMDAVTFQPGAIIAASVDSRSGLDGTGDTLFAAGDLQINAPAQRYQAGIGSTGSARVRIADNAPRLQGAAFGSRPDDFAIIQSAPAQSADLPLLADFGGGALTTLGGMDYRVETLGVGRDITLGSNGRLRGADLRLASSGDLAITGDLDAGALITSAPGETTIGADVTAAGGSYRGSAADADLSGGSLATTGTLAADGVGLSFAGDAQLVTDGDAVIVDPIAGASGAGGDLTIEALSGDLTQAGAQPIGADDAFFTADNIEITSLDLGGDLRLIAAGDATVEATGAVNLGGGASDVGGALGLTAGGDITDSDAASVGGETRLTTTGAIDLGLLDAAGTVFLDSSLFASVVNARAVTLGESTVGGDLSVTALSGGISDDGAVSAGGSAAFETAGTGAIALETTTAPGGFTLVTADGNATLAGADLTLSGAAISGDFVLDSASYTLAGDATATGTAELTGGGEAVAGGPQLVSAGGDLMLGGDLLKTSGGDLTLVSGGLMTLGGDLGAAGGSVFLNPAGRAITPDRATIAADSATGSTRIDASDRVVLGRREKLTALGALMIQAGSEIVTGDLNAFGDLTLTAPTLTLLTREDASLLEPSGVSLALTGPDSGVDLIAAGRIDINAASVVTDSVSLSDGAPLVATDGEPVSGAGSLERRRFDDPLTADDFRFAGVVLDLAAPPAAGPSGTTAGLEGDTVADEAFTLERPPQLDPALAAQLARLGVPVREPETQERVATVSGRGLYDDFAAGTAGANAARLSGAVARDLVASYDALAGEDFSRAPAVRERFARMVADAGMEPAELAERMAEAGAGEELGALARIDALLSNLGLTEPELREARAALFGRFTPAELEPETLRRAAEASGA